MSIDGIIDWMDDLPKLDLEAPHVSASIQLIYGEGFNVIETYAEINEFLDENDGSDWIELTMEQGSNGYNKKRVRCGAIVTVTEITDRMWESHKAAVEQAKREAMVAEQVQGQQGQVRRPY